MKKDNLLKVFFSDKRRFADIINGFACCGEQYVHPEDLQELDAKEGIWRDADTYDYNSDSGNSFFSQEIREKNRDVIWKTAFGVNFAIVGLENQEKIDYSMPYRVMSYDVSRYDKQMAEITDEGGMVDMCKAWKDGIERGRAEGKEEGHLQGMTDTLVKLIKKGYLTLDEAAKEFGVKHEQLTFFMTEGDISG